MLPKFLRLNLCLLVMNSKGTCGQDTASPLFTPFLIFFSLLLFYIFLSHAVSCPQVPVMNRWYFCLISNENMIRKCANFLIFLNRRTNSLYCKYFFLYITNTAWVRARLCKLQEKGALDSQPQVIKLTSCLPMVGGSLRVLGLLPPVKLVAMI